MIELFFNRAMDDADITTMKHLPRPFIIMIVVATIWTLLLPFFYHDLIHKFFYMPLLGIIGATVANTTPAAAGIVYFPILTSLKISPTTAVQFSLLIQAYGMSLGTYKWFLLDKRLFLWNALPVCLVGGLLGIGVSMLIFPITNPHMLSLVFNGIAFLFTQIIFFSILFRHQYPRLELKLDRKTLIILALCAFSGGLISGWIGFGIDTLFYFLLTLLFRINPVISIVTSISLMAAMSAAASVINCVVYDLPLSLWYAALPGVTIASLFLASRLAVKVGAKNILLLFTSSLSLNFLLSFWTQQIIPINDPLKYTISGVIFFYLVVIHVKLFKQNDENMAVSVGSFDLKP